MDKTELTMEDLEEIAGGAFFEEFWEKIKENRKRPDDENI